MCKLASLVEFKLLTRMFYRVTLSRDAVVFLTNFLKTFAKFQFILKYILAFKKLSFNFQPILSKKLILPQNSSQNP